jgi:Pycsar effector protein
MSEPDPIDTAWKIHGAISDWTGKSDTKASFALTIESAVLGGVIALSNTDRMLGQVHGGAALLLYRLGIATLSAGILCAAIAVMPRIRSRPSRQAWKENFIYFGHLRYWDASALEKALSQEEILPVLTRQLVAMSKIAWTKYRLVQLSMALSIIGTITIVVGGVMA